MFKEAARLTLPPRHAKKRGHTASRLSLYAMREQSWRNFSTSCYVSSRLKIKQALTPPNPKEFDSATLMAAGRALLGT